MTSPHNDPIAPHLAVMERVEAKARRDTRGRFCNPDPWMRFKRSEWVEWVNQSLAQDARFNAKVEETYTQAAEVERLRGVVRTAHTFNRNVCESWGKSRAAHKWFLAAGVVMGLVVGHLI